MAARSVCYPVCVTLSIAEGYQSLLGVKLSRSLLAPTEDDITDNLVSDLDYDCVHVSAHVHVNIYYQTIY